MALLIVISDQLLFSLFLEEPGKNLTLKIGLGVTLYSLIEQSFSLFITLFHNKILVEINSYSLLIESNDEVS